MKNLLRTILFTTLLAALFGFSTLSADLALAEGDTHGDSGIAVAKYVSDGDGEWQAAQTCCDPVEIEVGESVHWKLKVKNESDQPVKVVISDTLDGQPFELASYCTLPTDNTIAAHEKWTCEYETTAEAGEHTNVL